MVTDMIEYKCPVCGCPLLREEKRYVCVNRHNFDISKYGYVNLLMSNKSSDKRHGDDRLMIRSRRDFLSKGYYSFLRDEIISLCSSYLHDSAGILDAGCGECYYSEGIANKRDEWNCCGIDISRDALEFAHKRGISFPLSVCSIFNLPFNDGSFDCILNVFSPNAEEEFVRVLKNNGILVRVVPLEEHLYSLKEAVYDTPYFNEKPTADVSGLILEGYREIRKELVIDNNEDILNLFRMTPYYYKTSREDQQKLDNSDHIVTTAAFGIFIYRKNNGV